MNKKDQQRDSEGTGTGRPRPQRRPEGREGAGAHQEGKKSVQAGQGDRKVKASDAGDTDNDHQKTVQGKNQRGPDEKVGRDAGGNQGSKGQNVNRQGSQREEHSGKQSREVGDERGAKRGS